MRKRVRHFTMPKDRMSPAAATLTGNLADRRLSGLELELAGEPDEVAVTREEAIQALDRFFEGLRRDRDGAAEDLDRASAATADFSAVVHQDRTVELQYRTHDEESQSIAVRRHVPATIAAQFAGGVGEALGSAPGA